jgi:Ubiquitin carboxyl-terminal hydrolase
MRLDLMPYTSAGIGAGNDLYDLYAVVVHLDMLNASFFGHYICYIKDRQDRWYRADDCKVILFVLIFFEECLMQASAKAQYIKHLHFTCSGCCSNSVYCFICHLLRGKNTALKYTGVSQGLLKVLSAHFICLLNKKINHGIVSFKNIVGCYGGTRGGACSRSLYALVHAVVILSGNI